MHFRNTYSEEQKRLLKIHPRAEAFLKRFPGVVHVGLGIKEVNKQHTEDFAFRVYVREKLPISQLNPEDLIPPEVFGVKTDLLVLDEIEEMVCRPTDLDTDAEKYRKKGLRGGIQIRNDYFGEKHLSGFGTLGCLARRTDGNKLVGLGCAHVVNAGNTNLNSVDTVVAQPIFYTSCCCCTSGDIGKVLKATKSNT